jgi:predicted RND superfamily exporter protein
MEKSAGRPGAEFAMQSTSNRYFRWLVSHRPLVLALSGSVLVAAAMGALRVRIDYTVEQFFPAWGPERNTYERYRESFPKEDARFSLFWQGPAAPDAASYAVLEAAARVFEGVGLQDVHWLGSVEVAEVVEVDGEPALHIRPLVEGSRLTDEQVRRALQRHRDDRLFSGYLWNEEQSVLGLHGYLSQDENDDRRRREVEETLVERLAALDLQEGTLVLGGIPVVRSRLPKLLQGDQVLLLAAGMPVFFGLLFFFFRRVGQVVLCLTAMLPAYFCTVGLMGFAGKPITVLTIFVPIIVLVVGVSDSIHFLAHYRRARRTAPPDEAVAGAFTELATPCFYTSLTTAIGFASLMGTRIGIVVEFGLFTAIAILLTFVFSVTLLPVLLSYSALEAGDDRSVTPRWMRRIVDAAAGLGMRPSRWVVGSFAVVAVTALVLGTKLRVNTFLVDDLKETSGLIRDLRWVEAKGFGLFQVNVFLRQTDEEVLHHPDALRWMESFQAFVEQDSVVISTVALPDYLKQLRQAALDGEAGDRLLPATVAEASQLLFLAGLHDPEFVEDVYRELDGEAQVIVAVRDAGSGVLVPFLQRVDRYLEQHPPPVGTAVSTGTAKLLQEFTAHLLKSFGPSLLVALILITGVMVYMFRSLRYGMVALVPNLFPLVVLLGAMKLGGFDLKPSTILVFSIAFGLAVDDTIHLLGRFRRAIRQGFPLEAALHQSITETGPAILKTTIVVASGFSLLMFAEFEVMFLVGLMTAVSAVTAVAADLFLFPSFISLAWRRVEHCKPVAAQLQEV